MAKAKNTSKKSEKPRKTAPTLVNFKASRKDLRSFVKLAEKYAGGNYSAWLRHAGLNYRPKRGEVIR